MPSFARFDTGARSTSGDIGDASKRTGLATDGITDGIGEDVANKANKTFAGNTPGREKSALGAPGVFKGVDAANEAERKASDALVEAKRKERENTEALAKSLRELREVAASHRQAGRTNVDLPAKRENAGPDSGGMATAANDAASAAYLSAENTDTITGELITAIKEMTQKNEDGLKRLRDEIRRAAARANDGGNLN